MEDLVLFIEKNGFNISDKILSDFNNRIKGETLIKTSTDDFQMGKSISFKFESGGCVFFTLNKVKGYLSGSAKLDSYGTDKMRKYSIDRYDFSVKDITSQTSKKENFDRKKYLKDVFNKHGIKSAIAMMNVV